MKALSPRLPLILATFTLFLMSTDAFAGTVSYAHVALDPAFLQNWPGTLGLDFHVNSPIAIDALGVFDNGSTANLAGSDGTSGVTVQIFTTGGVAVGPLVSLTPASAPFGLSILGDFYAAVAPFTLGVGDYTVVTFNVTNYNSSGAANSDSFLNDGGGQISFVGSGRFGAGSGFPSVLDGGPADRYSAGTFDFTSAVPEPSTYAMLGFGLACLFSLARRKRTIADRTAT